MSSRNNRVVRNRERSSSHINGKTIGSVLAIILVIVVGIVFVWSKGKKQNSDRQIAEEINNISYEYFMLSSNENVGVIDKQGNLLIDTKYARIDIPNPSKDVFFCYAEDETKKVFNQKAEQILSEYEEVDVIRAIATEEIGEFEQDMEKQVLKYKKNDLYGLLDLDGKVITEAIYTEISSVKDRPGRILVKKENQYGILDSSGNSIIDTKYDSISADGYCSDEDLYQKTGYIVSEKTKDGVNFGYIDAQGNIVLDTKYETLQRALEYEEDDIYLIAMYKGKKGVFKNTKKMIDLNFQEIHYSELSKVFIVNKNGKYGFYKQNGKNILKPQYETYSIAGNYISVEKNGQTQLFDSNGNLVNTSFYKKMIETKNPAYFIAEDEEGFYSIISKDVTLDKKYVQVEYAFDNYFIVTDETGKTGVINAITQELEIEPHYDFIIQIDGTKVLQAIDGINHVMDIYSKDLTKTITMKDAIVENLENGFGVCYSETDMKYFNQEGEVTQNTEVYPNKKIYAIRQNDKWGFCDNTGKIIIEGQYDLVTECNEYGFAGIKKDNKWGVVNEKGDVLVEPTYELDTYYFPQFVGKYRLTQSEITYCEEVL